MMNPYNLARHVRIVYVLFKDEIPNDPLTDVFDYSNQNQTIMPPLKENPGYTYRILFDRTYTVTGGRTQQILVRIPGSVFYNKGLVKFRNET